MFSQPHTILAVEDERSIRALLTEILPDYGYKLLLAECGEEAVRISQACDGPIDLALIDLVLPGPWNGYETALQLLAQRPELKIVYTSGHFAEQTDFDDYILQPGRGFLQKPYLLKTMLDLIGGFLP
jgi:CheY-like chemotaxis protein